MVYRQHLGGLQMGESSAVSVCSVRLTYDTTFVQNASWYPKTWYHPVSSMSVFTTQCTTPILDAPFRDYSVVKFGNVDGALEYRWAVDTEMLRTRRFRRAAEWRMSRAGESHVRGWRQRVRRHSLSISHDKRCNMVTGEGIFFLGSLLVGNGQGEKGEW